MKKFLSAALSLVFIFAVSVTAFAEQDAASPDYADYEQQIIADANDYFYNGTKNPDDIFIIYFGFLSDGSPVVNVDYWGAGHPDVMDSAEIGDYSYYFTWGDEAYIYKNNTFYSVKEDNSSVFGDGVFDELVQISSEYTSNPDRERSFTFVKNGQPDQTETTVPATDGEEKPGATVEQPEQTETTVPATVEEEKPEVTAEQPTDSAENPAGEAVITESKPASTADSAVSAAQGGSVQTGQNNMLIMIIMISIISAGAVLLISKARR